MTPGCEWGGSQLPRSSCLRYPGLMLPGPFFCNPGPLRFHRGPYSSLPHSSTAEPSMPDQRPGSNHLISQPTDLSRAQGLRCPVKRKERTSQGEDTAAERMAEATSPESCCQRNRLLESEAVIHEWFHWNRTSLDIWTPKMVKTKLVSW